MKTTRGRTAFADSYMSFRNHGRQTTANGAPPAMTPGHKIVEAAVGGRQSWIG